VQQGHGTGGEERLSTTTQANFNAWNTWRKQWGEDTTVTTTQANFQTWHASFLLRKEKYTATFGKCNNSFCRKAKGDHYGQDRLCLDPRSYSATVGFGCCAFGQTAFSGSASAPAYGGGQSSGGQGYPGQQPGYPPQGYPGPQLGYPTQPFSPEAAPVYGGVAAAAAGNAAAQSVPGFGQPPAYGGFGGCCFGQPQSCAPQQPFSPAAASAYGEQAAGGQQQPTEHVAGGVHDTVHVLKRVKKNIVTTVL
jgi:hypothetical protein